jgi:transposase-like protein
MIAHRLTDAEKREIVALYRQSGETAVTLAERFRVSNSTIGRILKGAMSREEYDLLVQQKRSGRATSEVEPADQADQADVGILEPMQQQEIAAEEADFEGGDLSEDALLEVAVDLDEDILTDELEDDDLEEEDDDDDELEEDDSGLEGALPTLHLETTGHIQVLPWAEAPMPRVCYLVIDRGAELIAPPLRAFGELGQMSAQEAELKTLPVFDNHRVAKRFSNLRTQRVVKVPDSRLFEKASRHLQAKGIQHLLVDGQVYSLI